jgi:uncharacterized protein with ParB-like and HNH nuclease domain
MIVTLAHSPYLSQKSSTRFDYVLDGQQRLTSIFSTFQTDLKQNPETQVKWIDIYSILMRQPTPKTPSLSPSNLPK